MTKQGRFVIAVWALELVAGVAMAVDPPPTVRVADARGDERARILQSLQEDLGRKVAGASIQSCSVLITYVEEMTVGKDSSYGAFCSVKSGLTIKQVVMCNDWMVGKFTLADSDYVDRQGLIRFISEHCPPGG